MQNEKLKIIKRRRAQLHCVAASFFIFHSSFSLCVAEPDVSKLSPSAPTQIDFARDIQPIFEASCIRCHGAERPKSKFSLATRETALKGGANGVDIIPGDSAHSPLIHNVAGVIEDMKMPPPGKGEPLTSGQIGLLRAWIDQGALWSTSAIPLRVTFSASPTFRWITVSGNERKFREVENMREGFGGGLEEFSLREQISSGTTFTTDGHFLFPEEDFRVKLSLQKNDLGFVRAGFESWRKYFDDTGGFYRPFAPSSYDLNRDLHLNIGRAWIDFGLTRPDWPQMVLGYEYQFKEGDKSTLEWGDVSGKTIYPAAKKINEHAHILKFDLTHEISDWQIEDNARVEFFDSKTSRDNRKNSVSIAPPSDDIIRTRETYSHVQGQNALSITKDITDWLFVSGGYLYSKLEGDASFQQATFDSMNNYSFGLFWNANDIELNRETHSFSLATSLRPFDGLNVNGAFQAEWTRQESFGNVDYGEGDPNFPDAFLLQTNRLVESDLDKQKFSEQLSVRFTKIPFTVLFADARFDQEQIGQYEQLTGDEFLFSGDSFVRDTDFTNDRREYRLGFSTLPWRRISLTAHFKNRVSDSDYDHQKSPDRQGYSAFIRARQMDTDEAEAKLVVRPFNWLKTTLTYRIVATDFHTTTDAAALNDVSPGGRIFAGNYDANIYGINVVLTPIQRLYLSTSFTYSDTRTSAADNSNPSVVPYRGDVYSSVSSATFALNQTTDLNAGYSYTRADYGQNNFADGLPLGMDFERHGLMAGMSKQLTANLKANVRYGFFRYHEMNQQNVNDYIAHGIFATLTMKWP